MAKKTTLSKSAKELIAKAFDPSPPLTVMKTKKKIMRTGKCSTGKILKGNKCVPDPNYKKPAKKGFGEGVLYKKMEAGDKKSALSMSLLKVKGGGFKQETIREGLVRKGILPKKSKKKK